MVTGQMRLDPRTPVRSHLIYLPDGIIIPVHKRKDTQVARVYKF